ncbi:Lrp/AsnC family transcriptional regulator [Pedobacter sp. GR22-6]|uniref:Lrp/AsnC family transcriptional regulator n=1 Tax=Pedobacter sp. GR22-6 TaxID=3127957 RepID=UPI00307F117E
MYLFRKLDLHDVQIMNCLQKDARASFADISRKIHLSEEAIGKRTRNLENQGFILGYKALLNPYKVNIRVRAFMHLQLKQHSVEVLDMVTRVIQNLPEVVNCYKVVGEYDFSLEVLTVDLHAYHRFYKELLDHLQCIDCIRSMIVTDEIKSGEIFNLNHLPANRGN